MTVVPATNFNMTVQSRAEQMFEEAAVENGYARRSVDQWPCAPGTRADDNLEDGVLGASCFLPSSFSRAVWKTSDALALIEVNQGRVEATAVAADSAGVAACLAELRERIPPYESPDKSMVSATFWTARPDGYQQIRRDIDAAAWEEISDNYPAAEGLARLMSPDFRPGEGGQLILWTGEPGTGKTTALRALARLLNACDGLIGRGLRFLVLLTTNEEASHLHEAVGRPGRCAAQVDFKALEAYNAVQWLRAHGADEPERGRRKLTLAELYATLAEKPAPRPSRQPVGFAA
jgi:Domain of unknown function (DUF5925)/AAA domain